MERNIQKNGLTNLVLLVLTGIATFAVARYAHSLSGQVVVAFLVLGILVAAVSWFQMRLEARERLEKLEFDEVTRGGAGSSTLFTGQTETFPAKRAREQFERFLVPAFTVLLALLQGAGAWWIWARLDRLTAPPTVVQPLMAMAILGL